MVMICTACASDSTRRDTTSRSMSASTVTGGGASSTDSKPATLARPAGAEACSSSATWSTSVIARSPSGRASTRATTPLSLRTRCTKSMTPCSSSVSAQSCSCSWSAASSASGASCTQVALRPQNHDMAKVRARDRSEGRSRASSSQRHCSAAGDSSTLSPRASTAGTPCAISAACTSFASLPFSTRTAMSEGRTRRPTCSDAVSPGALGGRCPSVSSARTRATRSAVTIFCASPVLRSPALLVSRPSPLTRRRSTAGKGWPCASLRRRCS